MSVEMDYNLQPPTCQTYPLNWFSFNKPSSLSLHRQFYQQNFRSRLRSFLFSPFLLTFLFILFLSFSFNSQALSTHTTNVIHGTAPYLTFDGGQTRVTDINHLLAITLSNGEKITPETNNSSVTPIVLPNAGESFANIGMMIPTNINSISLTSLIGSPYNYWRDDDGDASITATGDLSLSIVDKFNQSVSRNTVLTICNSPYKVKLTSTKGILQTRYGVPNSSNFSASSVTYYINPKATPVVCFAKPDLEFGKLENFTDGVHDFRGPPTMWNENRGFIPQSTDPSSYHLNFPTTGMYDIYFDLEIGGSNQALSWSSVTDGDGRISIIFSNVSNTNVRVQLKGPHVSSKREIDSDNPSRVAIPSLPQTFELVGRDSRGNQVVKYGFKLKQWFINRKVTSSATSSFVESHIDWCQKIGYRLANVSDYTNASCQGIGKYACDKYSAGLVGALPSSPNNFFQRVIGAGLFSEWGPLPNYGIIKHNVSYAAADRNGTRAYRYVSSGVGMISASFDLIKYSRAPGACVYP